MFLIQRLVWVGAAAIAAVMIARWPSIVSASLLPGLVMYGGFFLFMYVSSRTIPKFSLRTLLLLLGLIGCCVSFWQQGSSWRLVHRFPGFEPNVTMSPDGSLVAASQDTSIEIRETKTGKHLKTLDLPANELAAKKGTRWFYEFVFSEDNETLLAAGWREDVCLVDWKTADPLRSWQAGTLPRIIRSGRRFMGRDVNGDTAVYQVDKDEPIIVIPNVSLSGGSGFLSLSPKGNRVALGSGEQLQLWDVEANSLIFSIPGPRMRTLMSLVAFSPDENFIALPTKTGVAIWDIEQRKKIGEWQPPGFDHVRTMEWSPDGTRLIASYVEMIGPSGPAAIAAAMAGKSKRNAIHHCYLLDNQCNEISKVTGSSATFSPTGDRIATVYGGCHILDGRSGKLLTSIQDASPLSQRSVAVRFTFLQMGIGSCVMANRPPSFNAFVRSVGTASCESLRTGESLFSSLCSSVRLSAILSDGTCRLNLCN